MKNQRGGTFFGLIVGVVIGLAVALGVAVYVTRVPVPFFNRGNSRTDGQDAAEAEKNRNWDPNAPLRGKNTVLPSSGSTGPASGPQSGLPVPPPAEVERSTAATPATPQPVRAPSASGDPLGALAAARLRQSGGDADALAFFVQAGAYRSSAEAEGQRARLSLAGVQAQISQGEQAGQPMYRVRVGPFQNRDAAERVKARLAENGFEAVLAGAPR